MLLLPPPYTKTFKRARGRWGPRGIGSGCGINSAREEGRRRGECILHKTSARLLTLESPARGCSGSKYLCVPGPAVQGKSSRAPSPPIALGDYELSDSCPCSRSRLEACSFGKQSKRMSVDFIGATTDSADLTSLDIATSLVSSWSQTWELSSSVIVCMYTHER